MGTTRLVITLVLVAGLMSERWRRHAVAVLGIWSCFSAVTAGVDRHWGWLIFYAVCGLGSLYGIWLGSRRDKTASDLN